MNVFIALAPVATTANIKQKELVFLAHDIDHTVDVLVNQKGFYNWFPPMLEFSETLDAFCALAEDLCTNFGNLVFDETIDNVSRLPMLFANVPAGSSYRNFKFYAQAINTGEFRLYDYGPTKN